MRATSRDPAADASFEWQCFDRLSTSNSDKESFRETVGNFTEQMRADFGIEYLIADSALYTAETLSSMNTLLWISRVPETLNLACDVIDVAVPEPVEGLRLA